ncbi:hypothetical protein F8M41_010016 [Gigaspora margarita]|uniref:Uncharacterized protein n=1 Tax=Gigaspora margarita TaxID=4874 RepID=A0A8H4EQF3_GIGMA|nr:hypothetical protein F8M41_010016 [Gigaspora margarita]
MIAVDNFENSSRQLGGQFQGSIGEDKKADDLPELDREIAQHTKCAENSEVGNVIEYMDIVETIEIVTHLFDPGGNVYPNFHLNLKIYISYK